MSARCPTVATSRPSPFLDPSAQSEAPSAHEMRLLSPDTTRTGLDYAEHEACAIPERGQLHAPGQRERGCLPKQYRTV